MNSSAASFTLVVFLAVLAACEPGYAQERLARIDPLIEQDPDLQVREFDQLKRKGSSESFIGEVVRETESRIVFQVRAASGKLGTEFTVDKADVLLDLRRNPPQAIYPRLKKRMGFEESDVEAQVELGLWCARTQVNLIAEARRHLCQAVRLDPKRAAAYEALLPIFDAVPAAEKDAAALSEELGVLRGGIEAGVRRLELSLRSAELFEVLREPHGAVRALAPFREAFDESSEDPALILRGKEKLALSLDATGNQDEARRVVEDLIARPGGAALSATLELRARWKLEALAAGDLRAAGELTALLADWEKLDPQASRVHLFRGLAAMSSGDFAKASQSFVQSLQRGGVGAQELLSYALNAARAGKNETAAALLRQTKNASSEAISHGLVRAYLLENQGLAAEAALLRAELERLPDLPWQAKLILMQAKARVAPGTLRDADVQAFIESYGRHPIAFAECALLYGDQALAQRDGPLARRWLSYAHSVLPDDLEVLVRFGCAQLLDGGDLELAKGALERARAISEKDPLVRNALGCLSYHLQDFEAARGHFKSVLAGFPAGELKRHRPPQVAAYALAGLRQAEDALTTEMWLDTFAREDSQQVLNNWKEVERYGVSIEVRDKCARLAGTQRHQDGALTILQRSVNSDHMRRVRATLRLREGAANVRVALRVELDGAQDPDGIVLFRETDGTIGFAVNRRGQSQPFVPKPPEPGAAPPAEPEPGTPGSEHDLSYQQWPDDGKEHVLEIRFDSADQGATSLSIDGRRVARSVQTGLVGRRGTLTVGVSGQAPLDAPYQLEVIRFEVFRGLPGKEEKPRR